MTTQETIIELDKIRNQVKRIRLANNGAAWLCELLKGIEILVLATKKAVEHVTKAIS